MIISRTLSCSKSNQGFCKNLVHMVGKKMNGTKGEYHLYEFCNECETDKCNRIPENIDLPVISMVKQGSSSSSMRQKEASGVKDVITTTVKKVKPTGTIRRIVLNEIDHL